MSDLYPGKWFTVTAMCMVFITAGASANQKNSISEHDDLGGAQPGVQGAEGALSESGAVGNLTGFVIEPPFVI